ncbi:GNAT family N-acetyltransferase [Methylorubrum thiocyanatum]
MDFDHLPDTADWWAADAVICALGTTQRAAGASGSAAAFRQVDHGYAMAVARLARTHGTPAFILNDVQLEDAVRIGALWLSPVSAVDLSDVEAVFDDLRGYSVRVDGESRRRGAAKEFATALPPGCGLQDKHAFVAKRDGLPVGLLDIIDGYPGQGVAFIGLLAVNESLHGAGIGRQLYAEAERYVRDRLGAHTIRLAVVEANPVLGFWQRMGFAQTGESKPYGGGTVASRAILLEKALGSASD